MKYKYKFLPLIAIILFYLMELMQAVNVSISQGLIIYLILGFIMPLPLLIGVIVAFIKLLKEKNTE
ncbi:MAG: hypothetical protein ACTSQO_13515 [Candidatus Helarchaeota archaeon]